MFTNHALYDVNIAGGTVAAFEIFRNQMNPVIDGDAIVYGNITKSATLTKGVVYSGTTVAIDDNYNVTLTGGNGTIYGDPDVDPSFVKPQGARLGVALSDEDTTISATIGDTGYNGGDTVLPQPVVTVNRKAYGGSHTLEQGADKDYTVEVTSDNKTERGAATATITGVNGTSGTLTEDFTIVAGEGSATVILPNWSYGQTPSTLQYSSDTNDDTNVSIAYKKQGAADTTYTEVWPTDAGNYTVRVIFPANDNYKELTKTADFTIETIPAPGAPAARMNVPYATNTVGAVSLSAYPNWRFISADTGKSLPEGAALTVTAEYTGGNQANYRDKTVQITITRAACTHPSNSREVRDSKPATKTSTGYTGDTYCTVCGRKIASGTTIAKLPTKVSKVTLNQTVIGVKVGKTTTLKTTVAPSNATNKAVTYKSSNTKVATVSSTGKIKGIKSGTCTITVTAKDGSKKKDTVKVTVSNQTITYKLNKGKNNEVNPETYLKSQTVNLKNPTRKGYTFKGCYTNSKFKSSSKLTKIKKGNTKNFTLYAKWQKVTVAKAATPKLANSKAGQLKVTYAKTSGASGYELTYATNAKFTKNKVTTTLKGTTKTITKIKKNTTYYVRIRAYKTDSTGAKVYGKYSSTKSLKLKR